MLYITGDLHGEFRRFTFKRLPQQREMTREDIILVTGDFGGLWDGATREGHLLNIIDHKNFTLVFADGNHENYDMLESIPMEPWNGGMVRRVRPNILHLCRGYVFNIDGKRVFVMGGAKTHDAPDGILPQGPNLKLQRKALDRRHARYRVDHESWWAREMPSQAEYDLARANLEKEDYVVDLVVSHCAPTDIQAVLAPDREPDELTDFLMEIREKLCYRHWFCGHYHVEKDLPQERFRAIYEELVPVE